MDLRSRKLASCQSQDFGRPPGRRRISGDRLPNKFEPKMTADYDPSLLHHCAEIFAKLLELMHSSLRLSNRYLLLCTSNLASSHRIETDVPLRSLFGQTHGPACRSSLLKSSTESRPLFGVWMLTLHECTQHKDTIFKDILDRRQRVAVFFGYMYHSTTHQLLLSR